MQRRRLPILTGIGLSAALTHCAITLADTAPAGAAAAISTAAAMASTGGTATSASAERIQSAGPHVTVLRQRDKTRGYAVFSVEADVTVSAGIARTWEVLTDYDKLAGFVPDLTISRVVSRDTNGAVVEQEGFGRFLFISQPIRLMVQATETPFSHIALSRIAGNMHEYQADWRLSAVDAVHTQITYSGTIAPAFYVPSLFGAALMKIDLRTMLTAVAREIEKLPE